MDCLVLGSISINIPQLRIAIVSRIDILIRPCYDASGGHTGGFC